MVFCSAAGVAVKVLLPAADPADARRFRREAVITARLAHPNIPPAHHLGTLADGSPFLDMKLVRGDTLASRLKARPDPGHDLPRLVGVFEAICQAVGFAHTRGVVHRDLKPANVMVGAFGEVQVMDWGIACEKDEGGRLKDESDTAPVSDSSFILPPSSLPIVGTPSYMAPEQARGEPIDARADVFALGGVLCATLTGHATFRGRDAKEVLAKAAAADVADAHARLDACGADPELVGLAKRCLAPDRVDRPADGTAVAAEVAAYRAGVEARLRAAEQDRAAADARATEAQKRRKVQLALAAAVAVIVAGGVGVAVWRGWEADRRAAEERQGRAVAGEAVAGLLAEAEAALGAGDADRAAPFVEQAARRADDAGLTDHAARLAAARADLGVLRALDRADDRRWSPVRGKYSTRAEAAAAYAEAFAGYGIVPGTTPPAEAAARVEAAAVRPALLTALDGWLAADPDAPLRPILDAADPDPFRVEVRRLLAARDRAALVALAGRPEWDRQPARVAQAFAAGKVVPPPVARPVLARVATGRADDFGLLMDLGVLFPTDTPTTAAERMRWFQAAAAVRPRNPAAHNNLGIALFDAGRRDEAVAAYREAIRLDPLLAAPHNNLGNLQLRAKNLPAAEAAYRDAIRLDPGYAAPHNGLGNVLCNQGDHARGEAAYRAAIRLDARDEMPHNGLGNALAEQGKLVPAAAAYRAAIALNPKSPLPHSGLGHVLARNNDLTGAAAAFREAARLAPSDPAAPFNLGLALSNSGDEAGAVAPLRRAAELAPADADTWAALGKVLRRTGDLRGSEAAYREAVRLAPAEASYHNALGAALEDLWELGAAAEAYREALRLDPKFGLAHANLGDVCRKQGRHADAVAAYRAALALSPDIRFARAGLAYCERVLRGDVPTAPPPRPVTR